MGFDEEIGRGRRTVLGQVGRLYVLVLVILLGFLLGERACFVPSLATAVGEGEDKIGWALTIACVFPQDSQLEYHAKLLAPRVWFYPSIPSTSQTKPRSTRSEKRVGRSINFSLEGDADAHPTVRTFIFSQVCERLNESTVKFPWPRAQ